MSHDHVDVEELEGLIDDAHFRVEEQTDTVQERDDGNDEAEQIGDQFNGLVDVPGLGPVLFVVLREQSDFVDFYLCAHVVGHRDDAHCGRVFGVEASESRRRRRRYHAAVRALEHKTVLPYRNIFGLVSIHLQITVIRNNVTLSKSVVK